MTLLAVWPRSPRLPSQTSLACSSAFSSPRKPALTCTALMADLLAQCCDLATPVLPNAALFAPASVTALILHFSLAALSIASLIATFAKQFRRALVTAIHYVQASVPVGPAHLSTYWQVPSHLDTAIHEHITDDSVMYGQCPLLRVPCAKPCTIVYTLVVSALTPFPTPAIAALHTLCS